MKDMVNLKDLANLKDLFVKYFLKWLTKGAITITLVHISIEVTRIVYVDGNLNTITHSESDAHINWSLPFLNTKPFKMLLGSIS